MRAFLLLVCLNCYTATFATAQVSITESPAGWEMTNGHIRVELARSSRTVQLKSLRREGGAEWAVAGTPLVAFPDKSDHQYRYADDAISGIAKGGKQLTLRFQSDSGGLLSLMLKLYPTSAVIELTTQIENRGHHDLLLDSHIDPLFLTMKNPTGGLKPYSSVQGQHGFQPVGSLSLAREFHDWLVLDNEATGESALIGGEPGLGILGWKVNTRTSPAGTVVRAGTILINDNKSGPPPVFELAPGETVETPITFFALAKGDADNAGNETFRYLKQYVFQTPLPNSPLVTYCIWLTEKNSEEPILKEAGAGETSGIRCFLPRCYLVRRCVRCPRHERLDKGTWQLRGEQGEVSARH